MSIEQINEGTLIGFATRHGSNSTPYYIYEEGDFYVFYDSHGKETHRHSKSMGINTEGFNQKNHHNNPIYAERVSDLIQNGPPPGVPSPTSGTHVALVVLDYLNRSGNWIPDNASDVHPAGYLPHP